MTQNGTFWLKQKGVARKNLKQYQKSNSIVFLQIPKHTFGENFIQIRCKMAYICPFSFGHQNPRWPPIKYAN